MEAAVSNAGGAAPSPSTVRKVALAAAAGSSIEWFDFFIYATAAALVFGDLFFPSFSPLAGTLAAFATFAVGFLARPVGGVIFGHYGDKLGRKPTLVIALVMMGVATFLIGVLPTYATIGVLAPVALVVLRFVQGLAVGGQWGGAMLLATEYAPPEKRGFYGSFAQIGVPIGVVLGNALFLLLAAVLSPEQFAAWGWRVPFLFSIVLIGIAMYIQLKIEDTPAFKMVQAQANKGAPQRSPMLEVIREHPKQILLAAGAFFAANGIFYITITGMLDYGTRELGLSRTTMLTGVLISSVVTIGLLPAAAALSDRFGRRPIYLAGAALSALWAFPLFWLIDTRSLVWIVVSLSVGSVFLSMMYGPQAALFAEMFSARVRYSGASLGYQIAAVFAGGLAPLIMTGLLAATGTSVSVSIYIIVLAVITFVSVVLITETYETEMAEEQGAAPRSAPAPAPASAAAG